MSRTSLDNFLKQKRQAKKTFAEKYSFSNRKPLVGIILDNELSKTDEECLKNILEGTAHIDVQVVVVADTNLDIFYSPHSIFIPYSRGNRKNLLFAADMALSFPFNDVEEMLLNGTIPISPSRSEVQDYDPNHETGNSFIYKKEDYWCVFAALVRALETFKFPYDWNNIVRQGLGNVSV